MISGPFKKWNLHPLVKRKPTVYFNVSMGDWLCAPSNWRSEALRVMEASKQHIFVTLTKLYDALHLIRGDSPKVHLSNSAIVEFLTT